jgi:hypothetical protein
MDIVCYVHGIESFLSWADCSSADEDIPRLSWNPNVQYHVRKILLLDHILSQQNPARSIYLKLTLIYSNLHLRFLGDPLIKYYGLPGCDSV